MTVALHSHVWNADADRSALVLHGLGSDGRTTWRIAEALADHGLRVVAPDLRGHGSSPPARSYEFAGYAADVRLLGSDWDVVVGHSLGGATAAVLATEPGWARVAVLIDPALHLPEDVAFALRQDLAEEVGGGLTAEALRSAHPEWDDEDVFQKVRASAMVSRRVTDRTVDDNRPWDVRERAARWACPVHVLAADPARGALLSADDARTLADLGDVTVTVTTVRGAGHSIHRDAPAAVVDAVLAALRV